jgi:hypothetical protein
MPRTFNGIGTKYFGASNRQPDGSFVTTEWFVLLDVPVIPLRSYRVQYLGEQSGFTKSAEFYNVISPTPLDTKQVLQLYAMLGGTLAAGCLILTLLTYRDISEMCCFVPFIAAVVFWMFIVPWLYKAK